jgi:uncharacterized peroxidase-related enzyme
VVEGQTSAVGIAYNGVSRPQAALGERERLIADFAVKVTRSPDACSPAEVQQLRDAGLSDRDILCVVEIVAYQNMSTRIMESLSTVD